MEMKRDHKLASSWFLIAFEWMNLKQSHKVCWVPPRPVAGSTGSAAVAYDKEILSDFPIANAVPELGGLSPALKQLG